MAARRHDAYAADSVISTRGLTGDALIQAVEHRQRLKTLRTKIKAFEIVGHGRVACVECGIDDIDMLVIDHVNDDGADDRRRLKNEIRGSNLYWMLVTGKVSPEPYQILCANHNTKKMMLAHRESRLRRPRSNPSRTRDQIASCSGLTHYRAAKELGVTPHTVRYLRALYGLDQ